MEFVLDADIVSTFAKIGRLSLLKTVFGRSKLLISPAVQKDLERSKNMLVRESAHSSLFSFVQLTDGEKNRLEEYAKETLGRGEMESIILAKMRNSVVVTNDAQAIHFAENLQIDVIDLETILYSLKEVIPLESLKILIEDIEKMDRVVVMNKEEILSS